MAAPGRRRGTFAEKSLPPAAGPLRRSAPDRAGKGRLITPAALAPPAPEVLRLHWRRPHALRSPPSPHVSSARPSAEIHYCVGGVAPTYGYSDPAPGLFCPKEKPRSVWLRGFGVKTLAMTYSRMLDAHYHRRVRVSLPSSEWNRVVPRSYCHQGEGGGSRVVPME